MTDFRLECRQWLEQNCPPSMRRPHRDDRDYCWGGRNWQFQSEDQRLWLERMASVGWTVPTWPRAYGGAGLDKETAKVLAEEMTRIGARPPLVSFGISMLGPALLKFGDEAQKTRHLPPIARGQIRWCQGYSEPNAGSDLASLQTKAIADGDDYIIDGQKIWASYADKADWIFCLVRTEFEGKHQAGISFILFDMASEGVRSRPIKLISGASPFCEIFFDGVRVPQSHVVGRPNSGWTIAKYLLSHEREMIGGFGLDPSEEGLLGRQMEKGKHDPIRSMLAEFDMDAMAFAATMERKRDEAEAGRSLGATASMLKYYGTELNKRRMELSMTLGGLDALGWRGPEFKDGHLARRWLRSKGNSIEGGTSEIQLNIVAKHLLGLPG